ncbi:MAG TPA: tetratricopeptide repeat protein [Coxiellaceae bacterium]|nr:MAG: hypothetical protein A3E81_03965 [Gammaproteobacteria bacterium RIFCSPHIGHO2_12_FULL_36_30]HLB56090.1 tetratricopeptide repeat protein [Coxiellaceae bacterium]
MLRNIFIFISICTVFLLSSCNGPGVNAYHHGNDAYRCGDYKVAFAYYLYAANQNVIPAQYAVGYQYFYGLGTRRNEPESILWFQRAAHASPRAQYALSLIQNKRPAQPWVFELKDAMLPPVKVPMNYNHHACMISVKCSK